MKTLTLGTGKKKRTWKLSEKEFAEFEARFEENEEIDMSNVDLSNFKLTLVEPPVRKPVTK